MHYIIEDCPLYRPPNSKQGLVALDGDMAGIDQAGDMSLASTRKEEEESHRGQQ